MKQYLVEFKGCTNPDTVFQLPNMYKVLSKLRYTPNSHGKKEDIVIVGSKKEIDKTLEQVGFAFPKFTNPAEVETWVPLDNVPGEPYMIEDLVSVGDLVILAKGEGLAVLAEKYHLEPPGVKVIIPPEKTDRINNVLSGWHCSGIPKFKPIERDTHLGLWPVAKDM